MASATAGAATDTAAEPPPLPVDAPASPGGDGASSASRSSADGSGSQSPDDVAVVVRDAGCPPVPIADRPDCLPVEGLFHKRLRVQLSDDRVVVGTLQCLDSHCNLLLQHAEQFPPSDTDMKPETGTRIGYVMVPGAHVVRCHELPEVCVEDSAA